jgi:hypothetical protein
LLFFFVELGHWWGLLLMQVQCSYQCNGGGISKMISCNYKLSSFCIITSFARMTIGTILVFTFCKFQLSSFCFVLLCKFKYSCRSEVSCFRVYGFSLIDSMHHGIFTTPKWFMNNLFFFVKVLSVVNVGTSNQVVNVVWNTFGCIELKLIL